MDIRELVNQIIPPSDYSHRNGFTNKNLIDRLSPNEREQLELVLLDKLLEQKNKPDGLVIETLTYLKSNKAIPILEALLITINDLNDKMLIASSIYQLNMDNTMFGIVSSSIKQISQWSALIFAFYYLVPFKTEESRDLLKSYLHHKNYLVRYNAKRALDMQHR